MIIEQFIKDLNRKAKSNGGMFGKADFHVHMPGSSDYEYKGADAMQKLADVINSHEYVFVIALEHQQFPSKAKIEELQSLCPNVCIVPGAELNVFVDVMLGKVVKDHYFHCIVAIDPNQSIGDYNFLIENAKSKLSYKETGAYPSGFDSSIKDIGSYFLSKGALFIPAHLHQGKPPGTSRSIDDIYDDRAFLGFIEANCFSAVEVRDKSTATFFTGLVKTKEGIDIPKITCVQSSDGHSFQHLIDRKRFTWVKYESKSFDELKAALSLEHRIELNAPDYGYGHIVGMHISGSFIKDEWIKFNPSMNCFIGGKGSGKTSILECLRFVLATQIPAEKSETVASHVSHILGSAGYVECLVQRPDKSLALITRRQDSPQRAKIVEGDDTVKEIESSTETNFDASILGWHEIESIAVDPRARMNLIDRVGPENEIKSNFKEILKSIEQARDELPSLQRKLKQALDLMYDKRQLEHKRQTLTKLEEGHLSQLQNEYEQYLNIEERLVKLKERVSKINRKHQDGITRDFTGLSNDFQSATELPEPIRETIELLVADFDAFGQIKDSVLQIFALQLTAVESNLDKRIDSAKAAFSKFRFETYDPSVNALPENERTILTKQIQIIEETKRLPELEDQYRSLAQEIRTIAGSIHDKCDQVCKLREDIRARRQKEIEEINRDIGKNVKVKFLPSAGTYLRTSFEQRISNAGDLFGLMNSFAGSESYEKLRDLFLKFKDHDITIEMISNSLFWDIHFIELLTIVDDDDAELSLVLQNGTITPIQNLSAGQKCTTVFPILLKITTGPLIVDQPEDNLDNRHIADIISPQFLSKKSKQQFILTSHNANLVVLTDSDLISHIDSDGSSGSTRESGFLACPTSKIKDAVLTVLDGGERALAARRKKYGL